MNERIKKLRRHLDLTQQEFADRIGVKRNTIANYEIGRNEPIDSVLALICREFHVNEEWLRTGNGEMFLAAPTSALDALASEQGLSHGEYILIEKFLGLKPELRQSLVNYVVEVAAALASDDIPASAPAAPDASREDLHAELDRQLDEEKEAEAKSAV